MQKFYEKMAKPNHYRQIYALLFIKTDFYALNLIPLTFWYAAVSVAFCWYKTPKPVGFVGVWISTEIMISNS